MLPVQRATIEVMRRWATWTVVVSLLSAAVAILLLAAGIGLVQRRRWSPRVFTIWAPLKIVLAIASTVVGWAIQQETMEAMRTQVPGMGALGPGTMESFASVGAVFALLWGCALPVFVLIWFARGSIKAQVAEWR